ncbi:hypothetical protein M885DRAFT_612548 [Pelagophyceae sp. CCMP2097]|nr:hypothetical protein M885DRAFT_612548 [Pelagophyceae sp. CCMP2097]
MQPGRDDLSKELGSLNWKAAAPPTAAAAISWLTPQDRHVLPQPWTDAAADAASSVEADAGAVATPPSVEDAVATPQSVEADAVATPSGVEADAVATSSGVEADAVATPPSVDADEANEASVQNPLKRSKDGWGSEACAGSDAFADVDDVSLRRLLVRQTNKFPAIISSLRKHGRKTGHWAWWAWPTDLEGASEPYPKTCVSPEAAPKLLQRAPNEWRELLELVLDLVGDHRGNLGQVVPQIDHGRIKFFIKFWRGVSETPPWLRDCLDGFEDVLPKASILGRHGAGPMDRFLAPCGAMDKFLAPRKDQKAAPQAPSRTPKCDDRWSDSD